MEKLDLPGKVKQLLAKYKYPLLILLAGLALMLLPERQAQETVQEEPASQVYQDSMTEQLCRILSSIDGAGKVEVLLTEKTGAQTIYQTDTRTDSGENTSQLQEDTVIVSDASRADSGLVQRVDPPVYQGAVIVCQGADNAQVRLAIVEAVSCATGLGANQISVVKMK